MLNARGDMHQDRVWEMVSNETDREDVASFRDTLFMNAELANGWKVAKELVDSYTHEEFRTTLKFDILGLEIDFHAVGSSRSSLIRYTAKDPGIVRLVFCEGSLTHFMSRHHISLEVLTEAWNNHYHATERLCRLSGYSAIHLGSSGHVEVEWAKRHEFDLVYGEFEGWEKSLLE